MNYKSFADLNSDINRCISRIPHDIDLIVGIPRSGLLVANILALSMNKQLTDLDSFLDNRIYSYGMSKRLQKSVLNVYDCKKVLVVEDSVNVGTSINRAKKRIEEAEFSCQFIYFAAYVTPGQEELVDVFIETLQQPRVFEWNLFHHSILLNSCMDIDGVLCADPTEEENDDGLNYLKFLSTAQPKLIPTREVKYLVSSRLEKYRKETEDWLKSNNITYEKLFLLDATAQERRTQNLHAKFKAKVYQESDCVLFIESNDKQARYIRDEVGKPVFCVDTNTFFDGIKEDAENKSTVRDFLARIPILRLSYHRIKDCLQKISVFLTEFK